MNRTYEYPILITLVMVHRNVQFFFIFWQTTFTSYQIIRFIVRISRYQSQKKKVIFYQKFSFFFFWRISFKTPIINIEMSTKCINRYESKQTEHRCKFELMIIH